MTELADLLKNEKDRLIFGDPVYQAVQCCLNGRLDIVEKTGAVNPHNFENPNAVIRMLKWITNVNQDYVLFTPIGVQLDNKLHRAILDPGIQQFEGYRIQRYGFKGNPSKEGIRRYTMHNFDIGTGYENMQENLAMALKYRQDLRLIGNADTAYQKSELIQMRNNNCLAYLNRNLFANKSDMEGFIDGWIESISTKHKSDPDIANILGMVMSRGVGNALAQSAKEIREQLKMAYAVRGWQMEMDVHQIYPIVHPEEGGAACFGKTRVDHFKRIYTNNGISKHTANRYFWKFDPFTDHWEQNPNELPNSCNLCKRRIHCPHILNQLIDEKEEIIAEKAIQASHTINLVVEGFKTYLHGTQSIVLAG